MATPKDQAAKILNDFKQFWAKQEKKNRILYITGLVAAIALAVIIIIAANHKDYVVLYEGLESSEAAQIVNLIEEAGYDCTLSGGTITVPEGTEDKLTMTLAQQGYPKSNLTYDLYTSNVGMFSTESEKEEYARMALESRLSAIISSLDGVDDAVVNLSIPPQKNTVISEYQADPTASVTVYLRDNATLSSKQIQGITHIVKMSVAGLTDENVSITDGYGVLLLADETDVDVIAEETRKLKFKTDLENQIKNKIIELLAPAYNDDGLSVAVNMVLNFDDKVSEDTVYTPSTDDGRGMLQEGKSENATGYATAEGGVVGVEVNADDTYPTGDTNGNGNWSESSVDNVYLVNTYKEQVEKAGYTIDSLSVSVVIYTDYLPDTTQQDLVSLVGNAASINPQVFNDVITVRSLPKYGDTTAPADQKTYLFGLTANQLIILAAILLGLLIILIIILAVVSNSTKKKRSKFEKEVLAANTNGANEPLVENFFSLAEPTAESFSIPSLTGEDEAETKDVIIKREIAQFSRQRPEIVAQLLRSWMNGDFEDGNAHKSASSSKSGSEQSDGSGENSGS